LIETGKLKRNKDTKYRPNHAKQTARDRKLRFLTMNKSSFNLHRVCDHTEYWTPSMETSGESTTPLTYWNQSRKKKPKKPPQT